LKFSANDNCPCGSLIKYKKCCKPFHEDIKTPINALELMKSRYCAYAIEKSEYIILTTHQNNRDFNTDTKVWNNDILDFSRNTKFEKLEILEFIDGQTESFVTFKANITQNKQDVSFIEKSRFVKENGKWQYIDGEFIN
jgi:SEC-C motif-containing protein